MCRNVGLLVVHVVEAKDIRKMDMLGKTDPVLEVYTQHTHVQKTVYANCGLLLGSCSGLPARATVINLWKAKGCTCGSGIVLSALISGLQHKVHGLTI